MPFALIENQSVRQIFAERPVLADTIDIREVSEDVQPNWVLDAEGNLSAPAPVLMDVPVPELATVKLSVVQTVLMDCFENSVPFPLEWKNYKAALKAILAAGELPPEGWPDEPERPSFD